MKFSNCKILDSPIIYIASIQMSLLRTLTFTFKSTSEED